MSTRAGVVHLTHESWSHFLVSPSAMKSAESALYTCGITSLELMERAGRALMQESLPILVAQNCTRPVIVCGPGNNGGDGLVIAYHLSRYYTPSVWIVHSQRYSEEFLYNLARLKGVAPVKVLEKIPTALLNFPWIQTESKDCLIKDATSGVIYDALLGTGARASLSDEILEISAPFSKRNNRQSLVISVDVPTGIDSDTGMISNGAVAADVTLTVEVVKRGMTQYPARDFCGDIITVPAQIPISSQREYLLTNDILPRIRKSNYGYKGSSRLLILAGSRSMPGAAHLVCLGAKSAGYIKALVPDGAVDKLLPSEVIRVLAVNSEGDIATPPSEELIKEAHAIVLGPGLGNGCEPFALEVLKICARCNVPVVVDASALGSYLAQVGTGDLTELKAIFTPHLGESRRIRSEKEPPHRFAEIEELGRILHAGKDRAVLLKGAGTLVLGEHGIGVVHEVAPFLATAGSGDVLSGLLGALLSHGLSPEDAANLGAVVHARAGGGSIPFNASELASRISAQLAPFYDFTCVQ